MSRTDREALQHLGSGWVDQIPDLHVRDAGIAALRKTKSWGDSQPSAYTKDKSTDDDSASLSRNLSVKSNWSLTTASTAHSEIDIDECALSRVGDHESRSFGIASSEFWTWPSDDSEQQMDVFLGLDGVLLSHHELPMLSQFPEDVKYKLHVDQHVRQDSGIDITHDQVAPVSTSSILRYAKSEPLLGVPSHSIDKHDQKIERVSHRSAESGIYHETGKGDMMNPTRNTISMEKQSNALHQACDTHQKRKTECDSSHSHCSRCLNFGGACNFDIPDRSGRVNSMSHIAPASSKSDQHETDGESSFNSQDQRDIRETDQRPMLNLDQTAEKSASVKAINLVKTCFDIPAEIEAFSPSDSQGGAFESAGEYDSSEDGPPSSNITSSSILSFAGISRAMDSMYETLSPFTRGVAIDLAHILLLRYGQKYDQARKASIRVRVDRLKKLLAAVGHPIRPGNSKGNLVACGQQTPPDSTQMSNSELVISLATPSTTQSNVSRRKHGRSDDNLDSDDEIEDKRTKKHKPCETSIPRLFACPYAKYDKDRYSERNVDEAQYRKCGTCMLRDISRLKQHLYRVHRRPEHYCPICNQACESQSMLDEHIRRRSCVLRESPLYGEKMTTDQMKEIKRRNKKETPVQNWFGIFKILFPDAPLPTSPYAGETSDEAVLHFVEFFRTIGPETMFELIRQRQEQHLMQPFSVPMQAIVDEAFEIAAPALLTSLEERGPIESNSRPTLQPIEGTNILMNSNVLDMEAHQLLSRSSAFEFDQFRENSFLQSANSDFFEFGVFDPSLVDDAFDAYAF